MSNLNERISDLEYKIRGDDLDISAIRYCLLELVEIVADLINNSLSN